MSESETTDADAERFPDEGSLAHVAPRELLGRLVQLDFTGRVLFFVGAMEGEIGVMEGTVVDARALGDFGPPALFRLLGATSGTYQLERTVSTSAPPQAFGPWADLEDDFVRHRTELERLGHAVGGLERVWTLRYQHLSRHLRGLPDRINPLLRRLDGRRTVSQVVTETPLAEPVTIRALHKLLSLGLLVLPDEPLIGEPPTSTIAGSLEGGRVEEIGSDLPVRSQWFDERHQPDAARAEERRRVLEGELAAGDAGSGDDDEDAVVPPADPMRALEGPDTIPEARGEQEGAESASDSESASAGDDVDGTADTVVPVPRPLPEPPDQAAGGAEEGKPPGVEIETWSTQGEEPEPEPEPAPPAVTAAPPSRAEVDQAELDEWLREEETFFEAKLEEMGDNVDEVEHPAATQPVVRDDAAPGPLRVLAAIALIAIGGFLGAIVVRGCPGQTPQGGPPAAQPDGNWSEPAPAGSVDG